MADDDRELRADFRKAIECTRTVLAGTSAEALERAKAVEVKGYAAGLEAAAKIADEWKLAPEDEAHDNEPERCEGDGTAHNLACDRITKAIRALGKEEKEDA